MTKAFEDAREMLAPALSLGASSSCAGHERLWWSQGSDAARVL